MEVFLADFKQWEQLYNCSRVNIADVPLRERQQLVNGTVMLVLFVFFETLYLPCLVAIWKHREHSCYKFLFYIGVTDVLMLPIQGMLSGIYSVFGVVFCSNPVFNFFIASCGAALFAAESSANFFLALDRLAETVSPKCGKLLFSGGRAWLWTIASSIFGLYYFYMVKPAVFAPTYANWFMNPYQDFDNVTFDPNDYVNSVILYYDGLLSFGFPAVYVIFVALFLRKLRMKKGVVQQQPITIVAATNSTSQNVSTSKSVHFNVSTKSKKSSSADYAKIVFIQVIAINGINVSTFVLYSIMQHLPMSKALIITGFYCNYLMFGIPPIVYLLVNRTIRNECRKMVKKVIKF
uniref:Uncharacterized protein n=1 Tax=Globodera rostochiensis TaxID=31243 RepID=A0A914HSU2_GLORO